jgi:hypothetical protein
MLMTHQSLITTLIFFNRAKQNSNNRAMTCTFRYFNDLFEWVTKKTYSEEKKD